MSALTSPANSGVGPSLPNDYVVDTESSRGNNNRLNKPNMNKERRFSKSRSLCGKDSLGLEGPYDLDVDEMLHGDLHNTSVASNPDHLVSNLAGTAKIFHAVFVKRQKSILCAKPISLKNLLI